MCFFSCVGLIAVNINGDVEPSHFSYFNLLEAFFQKLAQEFKECVQLLKIQEMRQLLLKKSVKKLRIGTWEPTGLLTMAQIMSA